MSTSCGLRFQMSYLIQECESENFCAEDLVERFAWRSLGVQKDDRFDAKSLEEAFRNEIESLRREYDHRSVKTRADSLCLS